MPSPPRFHPYHPVQRHVSEGSQNWTQHSQHSQHPQRSQRSDPSRVSTTQQTPFQALPLHYQTLHPYNHTRDMSSYATPTIPPPALDHQRQVVHPPPQYGSRAPQHHCSPLPPLRSVLGPVSDYHIHPGYSYSHNQQHGMSIQMPERVRKTGLAGRNPTSCDTCSKRKERCDRQRPCSRCVERKVGHQCSYTRIDPETGKGKKRKVEHPQTPSNPSPQESKYSSPVSATGTNHSGLSPHGEGQGPAQPSLPVHTSSAQVIPPMSLQGDIISHWSTGRPLPQHPPLLISEKQGQNVKDPSSPKSWDRRRSEAASGPSAGDEEGDGLMEENEAAGIGSRRRNQGYIGSEEERVFFGTSHFGPDLAARFIRGSTAAPLSDVRLLPLRGTSLVDDAKPYSLVTQIRSLLNLLPHRDRCDGFVQAFFDQYNEYTDIIYQPDFRRMYEAFWRKCADLTGIGELDLREIALVFIIIAFGALLEPAAHRLPPMQIYPGVKDEYSGGPRSKTPTSAEQEDLSLTWSWAAQRALAESTRFHGESLDTVRAGTMLTLYLVVCRRIPEAWTTIGEAIRAAHAQGIHVDGASWPNMLGSEAELRRRLWAQMYALDRSISLFLGRPPAMQAEYTTKEPANITDDELGLNILDPRPLSLPTKTTFLILHYRLTKVIDACQDKCFGLKTRSYEDVMGCEKLFEAFKNDLPPHFRLEQSAPDTSLDNAAGYTWLVLQRLSLTSKFNLARISLHRPYLLRSFRKGGEDYVESRQACVGSSIHEIVLRTTRTGHAPLDRFKWLTVASGFNPATIIGILCATHVRDPTYDRSELLKLLEKYIACEEQTTRRDEILEAELGVLRMMVEIAKGRRRSKTRPTRSASASEAHAARLTHQTSAVRGTPMSMSDAPTLAPEMPSGGSTTTDPGPLNDDSAADWLFAPPIWDSSDQIPGDADQWLKWFAQGVPDANGVLDGGLLGEAWEDSPVGAEDAGMATNTSAAS